MRYQKILFNILGLSWILCTSSVVSSSLFQGQVSSWLSMNQTDQRGTLLGIRYIPQFEEEWQRPNHISLNFENALNLVGYQSYEDSGRTNTTLKLNWHRLWFRVASDQLEIRVGLQKINFGSANMLRPLMWFDRLDPRDPLQLTEGVWGVLAKYYFLDNHTLWFWGLSGNDQTKGWEIFPSSDDDPEFGGRIQLAVPRGEIALTTHFRKAQASFSFLGIPTPGYMSIQEKRIGLDGKWDLELGLWFESSITHQDLPVDKYKIRRMTTFGADYTIGIGNGLYLMTEYLNMLISDSVFGEGTQSDFSAGLLRYPMGILDQVSTMIYYDWDNSEFYRLLSWQRTYDHWQMNAIGFWNPKLMQLPQMESEHSSFLGKGIQLMLVYNH